MVRNCYIHIPFCENICSYCDFCKLYYNKKMVSSYLKALEEEILAIYKDEALETIYIGGGSPSALSIEETEVLLSILKRFKRTNGCEITIELNFENTTKEKLDLYKKFGINRLSFGLETTKSEHLKLLERTLDKKKVIEIINYARKIGFNNINLDLIYAIPKQSLSDLEDDLNFILELEVEHISTYSLIIENHTKLKFNNIKNIDQDLDALMYELINNKLKSNGYKHYEISNFSKEGFFSKHNLCYWNNCNYYGFGLGASSYLLNRRVTNTRSLNRYLNYDFINEMDILSKDEIMEYEVILNLRKSDGINLEEFKRKYGQDFCYNYGELVNDGFLMLENNCLFIPENKWYISNEIIIKLLGSESNG